MRLPQGAAALALLLATAAPAVAAEPSAPVSTSPGCTADAGATSEAMMLARGIVAVAFPEDQRSAMMERLVSGLAAQLRAARTERASEPEIEALLEKKLKEMPSRLMPLIHAHMPGLLDATACAYTRLFTVEELRDISAFADTPSGSRFLAKSAETLVDPAVVAVNQDYFRAVNALANAFKQELIDEIMLLMTAEKPVES